MDNVEPNIIPDSGRLSRQINLDSRPRKSQGVVRANILPETYPALMVIEAVHHRLRDGSIKTSMTRLSRVMESTQPTYEKDITIEPTKDGLVAKVPLEIPKNCIQIVITNAEKWDGQVYPTDEQKAEVASRIATLGIVYDDASGYSIKQICIDVIDIRPGESCRFEPVASAQYVLMHHDLHHSDQRIRMKIFAVCE